MLSDDMDTNLREYYRWTLSQNPADISYPHQAPYIPERASSVRSVGLSDDEALWIDKALCQLKKEDNDGYRIIKKVYVEGKSFRQLEKHGWGDRKTIAHKAYNARKFVEGVIFGARMHS